MPQQYNNSSIPKQSKKQNKQTKQPTEICTENKKAHLSKD